MNRRGFVLVSVLWLSVILTGLGLGAVEFGRTAIKATTRRVAEGRGRWARAACAEILKARFARSEAVRSIDSTDLGQGLWCTASLTTVGRQPDLNVATNQQLEQLLGSSVLALAVRDWTDADTVGRVGSENGWYRERRQRLPSNRPLAALDELSRVGGFDAVAVRAAREQAQVLPTGLCPTACPDGTAFWLTARAFVGSGQVSQARLAVRRDGWRLAVLLVEAE